jgi:UDP-glucose 4-epimerase
MRILITGSSGQIGTNLALGLQAEGHTVFGIDKRPNTWTDQIDTRLQDLSQTYHDFDGCIGPERYPSDLDVVVHLAAYAKVHELVEYPDRALENITMLCNVLEFCRQNNLPIIFGSSREVYGNIYQERTSETEADFQLAASPYAASKMAGEAMVYAYARCYDLPYIVFRFSNVYGRYDNDLARMERVIPLFMQKMKDGEPITIFGEDKMLDFTYVDDCIAGMRQAITLLAQGERVNQTINLAYGEGSSLVQMTDYIAEALGVTPDVTIEPSRVGEVTHYVADLSRAREILDYAPSTPLREGIHKTVAWADRWAAESSAS